MSPQASTPTDRQSVVPVLFASRCDGDRATNDQYADTTSELDQKSSDRHVKERIRPVRWPVLTSGGDR